MFIGVDYYPEHWDRKRWETDARLIKSAGFNVVRMAEFAWIKMEPLEGKYEFDWLDSAIDILYSHGIKSILGTPTGSMPAWVAKKYPGTVSVDMGGNKSPYGFRKDNCSTSAGPLGNRLFSRNLRPNEMRRMNYQAVAHGADGLLWFRWRTCRYGYEQFCHGLLGHDGIPGRRYKEASRFAKEVGRLSKKIEGSVINSEVAILYDYDDRWAFDIQPNSGDFDYLEHLMKYYSAVQRKGINIDFVRKDDDISEYKLLIVPCAYIMNEKISGQFEKFVKNGGVLLVTFRTGVKDEHNVPHDAVLPGFLRNLAGVRVEEYESLSEPWAEKKETDRYKVAFGPELGGGTYDAGCCVDWVMPENAKVLAEYDEPHLKRYCAVSKNGYGKGKVFYVGTQFAEWPAYDIIVGEMLKDSGIKPVADTPENVEVFTRSKKNDKYVFVLNHNDNEVETVFRRGSYGVEIITGRKVEGRIRIPAGDLAIIKYISGKGK